MSYYIAKLLLQRLIFSSPGLVLDWVIFPVAGAMYKGVRGVVNMISPPEAPDLDNETMTMSLKLLDTPEKKIFVELMDEMNDNDDEDDNYVPGSIIKKVIMDNKNGKHVVRRFLVLDDDTVDFGKPKVTHPL